jgi:hypothetical protein
MRKVCIKIVNITTRLRVSIHKTKYWTQLEIHLKGGVRLFKMNENLSSQQLKSLIFPKKLSKKNVGKEGRYYHHMACITYKNIYFFLLLIPGKLPISCGVVKRWESISS